jgi:hypothetical protein
MSTHLPHGVVPIAISEEKKIDMQETKVPVKWCCMLAIAGNLHGKFPRGPTAPIHNETQISYM